MSFQCAWLWESLRDQTDVIDETQTNEVSLYRQTYTSSLSWDNEMNVKLGDINNLQKTYSFERYRPLTEAFPQASMTTNLIYDMELWLVTNATRLFVL